MESPDETDPEILGRIATSLRGGFQTVEDMTQLFIREAIAQGVFRPGERLNLDLIASTLGVSRMPVRASLRLLAGEGLLTIHPYRGATVSVLGAKEIAEIYELRILLESYLLENAMRHLDESMLEDLRVIVHQLETSDDLGLHFDKRHDFYAALYGRAHRPRALTQVNHLRRAVGRYLLLRRVDEHPVHADFLALIELRDVGRAKAWLAGHLGQVSAMLQDLLGDARGRP